MKIADDNGNCPGCGRGAQHCRDHLPCEYRRHWVRAWSKACFWKLPFKESERAVAQARKSGLIRGETHG